MRQRFVFVVLLNLLLFLSTPLSNAQDDRLQVVGSHSILSDVIANVAGDVADVTSLMPRGADPHAFQPAPSDLTGLADADVVFINGAFFEEGLLDSIENASDNMNIVTVSSCVEIIPFGGHADEHDHDEDDEHTDDHEHDEGDEHTDEHDHDEGDEHADEHDHDSEMDEMSAIAQLCEQHYAEMVALHEASHDHGDEEHNHDEEHDHEMMTDVSSWNGSWITTRRYSDLPEMQPIYANIAQLAEISVEDAEAFVRGVEYVDFDEMIIVGQQITYVASENDLTCDYLISGEAEAIFAGIPFGTWHLLETNSSGCAEYQYLALTEIHTGDFGDVPNFHLRYGSTSFEDLTQAPENSTWFATVGPPELTAEVYVNSYSAGAEGWAAFIRAEMGDSAMLDALLAAGEDHDHEHEEEGAEHDHDDEDHEHEEHSHIETLGALYSADCGEGHAHHEEEGEHEEEDHADGDEHDHGACDPHVWMEPHNVMFWTMLIRDTLIELDPDNAEIYTANATSYLAELDALAHDFVAPMVETLPEENRILITNHDAFGYFATRYEFEVTSSIIPSLSTLAEPSSADVAEIIDLIREQDIPAIFAETTVSDDLVQQIADETGVQFYVLYSGSLSESDGPASTYVDYIRYNVTTIVEALGEGM